MSTVLLAVDVQHYAPEAAELTRDLCRRTGDTVLVLHVHEHAVGRFGKLRVCCLDDQAEQLLPEIVAALRDAGITAEHEIHETLMGSVAHALVEVSDQRDARLIVVGSRLPTDLPHITVGSVSNKLLHLAKRPVLVVPHHHSAGQQPEKPAPDRTAQPVAD
jgi:nucleotide-binding universal stress UspA family protein